MEKCICSKNKEQQVYSNCNQMDLYDLVSIDWPDSWSREDEYETPISEPHKRFPKQKATSPVKTKFVVKIRLHNDRVYTVAELPIDQTANVEDQEVEIFDHFYKKLNKRHFHIQKPSHRVFRTSIIDELFITRI